MKMSKLVLGAGLVWGLCLGSLGQATTVVQWNFQTPDEAPWTGTDSPNIGSGSITTIGGATHPSFNSGNGSSDPIQNGLAYQTTTYPAQGTASGTAGPQFNFSTVGFESSSFTGLDIRFDLRTSNTSSRWYRLDYSANGSDWVEGTATRLGAEPNAGDTFHNMNTISVTDTAMFDNVAAAFRVVSVFSPEAFTQLNGEVSFDANTAYEVARNTGQSAYAGGTWRFDNVTVTAVPEPSGLAILGLITGVGAYRVRRRFAERSATKTEV